ncbi:MAG TPA: maltose acetyltransferase domain-containing protein [Myxococcus sp.]|nr:maltose acetyltransferase domain-containing protein [Myxococcus sp.]
MLYVAADPELVAGRARARKLLRAYNPWPRAAAR